MSDFSPNFLNALLILRKQLVLLFVIDPTHVIGLYPDLLPSDYRKQLHYPNPLPTLSGAELEKAHLALIDYLTQVHRSVHTHYLNVSSVAIRNKENRISS